MKWKGDGLSDFRLRLAQDLEREIGSSRDGRRFALWRGFCCSFVLEKLRLPERDHGWRLRIPSPLLAWRVNFDAASPT